MEVKMAQIVEQLLQAGFAREEIELILIAIREEELREKGLQ